MKPIPIRHIVAALFTVAAAAAGMAQQRDKIAPAPAYEGRIARVDADRRLLSLSDVTMLAGRAGERDRTAALSFTVSENARVTLDGKDARLRDLREGLAVRVEVRTSGATGRERNRDSDRIGGTTSGTDRAGTSAGTGAGGTGTTGPAAMRIVDRVDAVSRAGGGRK